MFFEQTADDSKLSLDKMLKDLESAKKGNRIPVLNDKLSPRYVVHRSLIDKYLAKKSIDGTSKAADIKTLFDELKKLSLKDLIESQPELKQSFGLVSIDSTLADAKTLMDALGKTVKTYS